jgi:hypothetical protein
VRAGHERPRHDTIALANEIRHLIVQVWEGGEVVRQDCFQAVPVHASIPDREVEVLAQKFVDALQVAPVCDLVNEPPNDSLG